MYPFDLPKMSTVVRILMRFHVVIITGMARDGSLIKVAVVLSESMWQIPPTQGALRIGPTSLVFFFSVFTQMCRMKRI
jgi:hypothetical protein